MTEPGSLRERAKALGLKGALARWGELAQAPWLKDLVDAEEAERARRSPERRQMSARLGRFKQGDGPG